LDKIKILRADSRQEMEDQVNDHIERGHRLISTNVTIEHFGGFDGSGTAVFFMIVTAEPLSEES
jgi:hypothetical protein